jgi:hypothetical protein
MSRAAHAAATDGIKKVQAIAAKTLGGQPGDYVVDNERVVRKGGGRGMTLASQGGGMGGRVVLRSFKGKITLRGM